MSDPVDPRRLARGRKPARVETVGDRPTEFVAHAETMSGGWLQLVSWQGRMVYIPREEVRRVERLKRERWVPDGADKSLFRLADPERRADALEAAGLQDTGAEGTGEDGSDDPSDDAEVLTDG